MMKTPRREAELWWYADAGAACNRTVELPRVPFQVARCVPRGRRDVSCCTVLCARAVDEGRVLLSLLLPGAGAVGARSACRCDALRGDFGSRPARRP